MSNLQIQKNPTVDQVFQSYPDLVQKKIRHLRSLILEVAQDSEEITSLEETLKWGEPSYLVKKGSTIRIDWKQKTPHQYAMYFKCTSKLVSTFKLVYKDVFNFEGNRAIVFELNDKVPEMELKKCISAGLNYHRIKHLPLLGM